MTEGLNTHRTHAHTHTQNKQTKALTHTEFLQRCLELVCGRASLQYHHLDGHPSPALTKGSVTHA